MPKRPVTTNRKKGRSRWAEILGHDAEITGHVGPKYPANRRANRMKVLVHDGIGVWLAARRLNSGKFVWLREGETTAPTATLNRGQFDALVLGLPWKSVGDAGIITVL